MSETTDARTPDNADSRRTLRQVLLWTVGLILAAFVLLGLLRVFIRPIPPGQEVPLGHFGEPCWGCHLVSESADPVELP